jgi:CoA:oxalate CoA-transferase
MIVNIEDEKLNNFSVAGNPIKMSLHEDRKTRKKVPKLDEHREKLLKEFKVKG